MKPLHVIHSATKVDEYRSGFSGERLGWTIHSAPALAFRPVHRIEMHIEDGPVVLLGDTVFEVDPETDEVFSTDDQALDAYYKKQPAVLKTDFTKTEANLVAHITQEVPPKPMSMVTMGAIAMTVDKWRKGLVSASEAIGVIGDATAEYQKINQ